MYSIKGYVCLNLHHQNIMSFHAFFRCSAFSIVLTCASAFSAKGQTDFDHDMMAKNLFCSGFMYSSSSWDHYWEGTQKRTNENIGTVNTKMFAYMGNYGVSKKLNLIFNLPYIKTKASAGTLQGLEGVQDLSLVAKWKAYSKKIGPGTLSMIG